ncbi:sugar kinase [Ferdinandcohnia quinoae]|uniref:Sugar kinase n=1 Tax=Fredinandcohnia quinoae TaxID=2918902 RepID=A0AAW5E6D9_9BACI|nr:sugar kinase [Fredinandcohnia sp. SECRCQ15]MCH1624339.1 sugar kinase [Fredinandcohnia sp. SECRCQ15]
MRKKVYAFGEVMMRLEAPNFKKLEQTHTLDFSFSGTGVNVLSALSHYGHHTSLITKLPANRIGNAAAAFIRSLGIGIPSVVYGGNYIGMYILERGFGPRPSKVTYTNRVESSFCQSSLKDYQLESIFEDASLVHFCGISLAVSKRTRDLTLEIARKAKERGIKISFDCNYRPSLWEGYEEARPVYKKMLELCDICFMNEKDALHLLEIPTTETELERQIESLLPIVSKLYKIPTIAGTIRTIISTDKQLLKGFLVKNNEVIFSVSQPLQILDRIGGGDGFASGILHGELNGLSAQDTINFAVASGILAHSTYGDSPISSLQDVLSFLNQQNQDVER